MVMLDTLGVVSKYYSGMLDILGVVSKYYSGQKKTAFIHYLLMTVFYICKGLHFYITCN